MFRESFSKNEIDLDRQVVHLDLRNMATDEAMANLEEAVEKVREQEPSSLFQKPKRAMTYTSSFGSTNLSVLRLEGNRVTSANSS